jgi:hypothetical protein
LFSQDKITSVEVAFIRPVSLQGVLGLAEGAKRWKQAALCFTATYQFDGFTTAL